MSENKPMELSAEDLDNIAGGAFGLDNISNLNTLDTQASLVNVGADGGIQSAQVQKTTESKQTLQEIKATGEFSVVPANFFQS